MKVILIQDIDKVGKVGEVADVKDGYARNFLFPRKLAIEAIDSNLKLMEAIKKRHKQKLAKEKSLIEELATKIGNMSCTIPMAAGEEDKLFGSVTSVHIVEALSIEGINIDKRQVHLDEPIRKLGVYQVEIKLHPEVTTSLKVWVVKK